MLIRMDIKAIMVGGGPIPSVITLSPRHPMEGLATELPIRVGVVEAAAISTGIGASASEGRPRTPDLLLSTIRTLGAEVRGVSVVEVHDTTFFANLLLERSDGTHVAIDCRPSDALALAVRAHVPIYAEEAVLRSASMPDFAAVEKESKDKELQDFHSFVESLSADDFTVGE